MEFLITKKLDSRCLIIKTPNSIGHLFTTHSNEIILFWTIGIQHISKQTPREMMRLQADCNEEIALRCSCFCN